MNVTFELAQEEIASKAGYNFNGDDPSMEQALLNQELLELIPAVDEANAISEELERMIHFEPIMPIKRNNHYLQPHVKVTNSNTGQEFEWSKAKFFDRLYLMKEMYHNYETGEEEWDLPYVSRLYIGMILYIRVWTLNRIRTHSWRTHRANA